MFNLCNNINTNMNKYNRYYNLSSNRLSSGKSINTAKDNPSSILKINRIESIIRQKQAINKNIQSAISYIDIKETTLNTIRKMTNRIEELGIEYSNDLLNKNDKDIIKQETLELLKEINYTIKEAKFNSIPIFNNKDVKINDFNIKNLNFDLKTENNNIYIQDFKQSYEEKTFNLDSSNFKKIIQQYNVQNGELYETNFNKISDINFSCNINTNNCLYVDLRNIYENTKELVLSGKGNLYKNEKYNNIDFICKLDKDNHNVNINFTMGNNLGTVKINNIKNIQDLKNIKDVQVSFKDKISMYNLNDAKITFNYEQKITNMDTLYKNLYKNNSYVICNTLNGDKISFDFINNKINVLENYNKKKWESIDLDTFLEENMIDKYIGKPINNYLNYLGIKENEFIRQSELNETQNNVMQDYFSKISDVDMAKEMLQLTKNKILLNVNNFLFKDNLNKDRMYIQNLLN